MTEVACLQFLKRQEISKIIVKLQIGGLTWLRSDKIRHYRKMIR